MSRDPSSWMWAEAVELIQQAERLHRQFFQFGVSSARAPAWQPPLDIFETDQGLRILIALPGVPPGQIQVAIDGDTLIISGNRPLPPSARTAMIHRLEIPHGRFERRIELPSGRFEFDEQELAHGCLTLSLRKL